MQSVFRISERRASKTVPIVRSTKRYKIAERNDEPFRSAIKDIAQTRPRYGYKRVLVILRRKGYEIGKKKVYRMFSYDNLGNIKSTKEGTINHDGRFQEIISDYKYTYWFDKSGNLSIKEETLGTFLQQFTYNSQNQLVRVDNYEKAELGVLQNTLNDSILFSYDPSGRRIKKQVLNYLDSQSSYTRYFVYAGQEIISVLDENLNILVKHHHSFLQTDDLLMSDYYPSAVDKGLAQKESRVIYLKDHLGTIKEVVDTSDMKIKQREHYSAFGRRLASTTASNTPFESSPFVRLTHSFTGREYDEETGLYYYRARYMDPNLGRFLQLDPDPGSLTAPMSFLSKYSYVANNPVHLTDASGMSWLSDLLGTDTKVDWNMITNSLKKLGGDISNFLKSKDFQKLVVFAACVIVGLYVGPLMAGAFGLTGTTGAIAAGIFGAQAGGLTGAALYTEMGLGSYSEGFRLGAVAGGLGGFYSDYSGSLKLYNKIADTFGIASGKKLIWGINFGSAAASYSLVNTSIDLYNHSTNDNGCAKTILFGIGPLMPICRN